MSEHGQHKEDIRAWRTSYPPDTGAHQFFRIAFKFLAIITFVGAAFVFAADCVIAGITNGGDMATHTTNVLLTISIIGGVSSAVFFILFLVLSE